MVGKGCKRNQMVANVCKWLQTEPEYWRLRPFDSCPAMFYGLPKVHKVPLVCNDDHFTLDERLSGDIPLRPINSNVDSPTYQLSKYLANLLKHLCLQNVCTINNGKEFAEFVCSQKLDHDETIVSFDIVSLFTSIPVPLALNVVKRKLSENDVWRSYTNLKDKLEIHACSNPSPLTKSMQLYFQNYMKY